MEKIIIEIEALEEKKVSIGMYYLIGEVDIWWNTIKDRLIGPEFIYYKFLQELRAKLYPAAFQRQ